MHYNFGIKWLKAFRSSSEEVCALYNKDGFVFEDVMFDQHNLNDYEDLLRNFAPYANKDPEAGIGIHNFRIRSYTGDNRSGLLRWEWSPDHCAMFLGVDVVGKPFITQGHTFHQYNEKGLITRESSWWDSSAFMRQAGPINPTKSLTGKTSIPSAEGGTYSKASSGMEHAQNWCAALSNDVADLRAMYADYFTLEYTMVDDHEQDTITDSAMLADALGGISTKENGTYTFTATEVFEGNGHQLTHWNVTIEGAETWRGMPTEGKTLTTIGSTFHEFDGDGKILLESTVWEDNRVFVQLGVPLLRPHYWRADFDMAAFVASLGG